MRWLCPAAFCLAGGVILAVGEAGWLPIPFLVGAVVLAIGAMLDATASQAEDPQEVPA